MIGEKKWKVTLFVVDTPAKAARDTKGEQYYTSAEVAAIFDKVDTEAGIRLKVLSVSEFGQ